jgi:hypothetical protein
MLCFSKKLVALFGVLAGLASVSAGCSAIVQGEDDPKQSFQDTSDTEDSDTGTGHGETDTGSSETDSQTSETNTSIETASDTGSGSGTGPEDTSSATSVNQPPIANAGGDRIANVNELIWFDASASHDPDGGEIVNWMWDFGGGEILNGKIVSYTFNSPGNYPVTLTVFDDDNTKDQDSITVQVVQPPIITNVQPSVGARAGDTVTVHGLGFGANRGSTKVFFGGVNAVSTPFWSDTFFSVVVPEGARSNIVVDRATGITAPFPYNVWEVNHKVYSSVVGGGYARQPAVEIALDGQGHAQLLYYDVNSLNVWSSFFDGNNWSIPRMAVSSDDSGYSGGAMSLGPDDMGNLHLGLYSGARGRIGYNALKSGGIWDSTNTLVVYTPPTGQFLGQSRMATSSVDGESVFIYTTATTAASEYKPFFKTNSTDGGFSSSATQGTNINQLTTSTVRVAFGITGEIAMLTMDSSDGLMRLYKRHDAGFPVDFFDGTVNSTGLKAKSYQDLEVALDSYNRPIIAYIQEDSGAQTLSLATYGGALPMEVIDLSNKLASTPGFDMKVDRQDNIYVAFTGANRELRLVKYNRQKKVHLEQVLDVIDAASSFVFGVSLALDEQGFINVVYAQNLAGAHTVRALVTRK